MLSIASPTPAAPSPGTGVRHRAIEQYPVAPVFLFELAAQKSLYLSELTQNPSRRRLSSFEARSIENVVFS